MLKLIASTPRGNIIDTEIKSAVIKSETSSFGILENRIPIITKIKTGAIIYKYDDNNSNYIGIEDGIVDYKENIITVVCKYAALGDSFEDALMNIQKYKDLIVQENKRKVVDFVEAEKDLIRNIQDMKATKE